MADETILERIRGFIDYADYQLLRGNVDAAKEALANAERLDLMHAYEEELEW
jgi:hypothetical protein